MPFYGIKETMAEHRTYQITRRSFLKPSGFTNLAPSKNLDRTKALNEFEYVLFSRLSNIQLRQCTFNVQFFHPNVQFFRSNVRFLISNRLFFISNRLFSFPNVQFVCIN